MNFATRSFFARAHFHRLLSQLPIFLSIDKGVTTAVDGGSAGCMTFAGFRRFIAERSETRVLAFLHVACHGLAGAGCSGGDLGRGGESDHLNAIKTQGI